MSARVKYIESTDDLILSLLNSIFENIDFGCKCAKITGKRPLLGIYVSTGGLDVISIDGNDYCDVLKKQIVHYTECENFELCSILADYVDKVEQLYQLEEIDYTQLKEALHETENT